jgi:KDO2-lipid IV(A) lauroyltransferase
MPRHSRTPWQDRLVDRAVRLTIGTMLVLPYRWRVPLAGWLFRQVGRLVGYRDRAEENLTYIFPDMPAPERRRIARAVLDNFGRVLIENYGTADQLARAHRWQPEGAGFARAEEARAAGLPILLVSGHFGNYQAVRAALNVRGYAVGGLYRAMNNPYLNDHYVTSVAGIGGPVYPRDRRGLAGFVKTLRQGGQTAMLIDQYFADGVQLDFMGQPAPTSLSAAEMALKYDALLIPAYAERSENGLDFTITLEEPIVHSDPRRMTQALNHSLAARVQARPGQWFWVHRRWKPGRQARYFPPYEPDEDRLEQERDPDQYPEGR